MKFCDYKKYQIICDELKEKYLLQNKYLSEEDKIKFITYREKCNECLKIYSLELQKNEYNFLN